MDYIVTAIVVFIMIKLVKSRNARRANLGLATYQDLAVVCAIRALSYLISVCTRAQDQLVKYQISVEMHQSQVVVPFLHAWMNEELSNKTLEPLEAMTCRAVNAVCTDVGLRSRCAATTEAIGRQLRRKLVDEGMENRDVPYWSELGIHMYFNPPASVKAATGRIEGFQ
jgi:hypothetical protein